MAENRAAAGLGKKGIVLAHDYEFSEAAHVRPPFKKKQFMESRLSRAAGR
jgi:hypothetical protein